MHLIVLLLLLLCLCAVLQILSEVIPAVCNCLLILPSSALSTLSSGVYATMAFFSWIIFSSFLLFFFSKEAKKLQTWKIYQNTNRTQIMYSKQHCLGMMATSKSSKLTFSMKFSSSKRQHFFFVQILWVFFFRGKAILCTF